MFTVFGVIWAIIGAVSYLYLIANHGHFEDGQDFGHWPTASQWPLIFAMALLGPFARLLFPIRRNRK